MRALVCCLLFAVCFSAFVFGWFCCFRMADLAFCVLWWCLQIFLLTSTVKRSLPSQTVSGGYVDVSLVLDSFFAT